MRGIPITSHPVVSLLACAGLAACTTLPDGSLLPAQLSRPDEVEVTELRDGKLSYKVKRAYKVYPDGATKKLKKGFVFFGFGFGGIDFGLILLPIVCIGGLLFFFWMRRNPMRPSAAA